MWLTKKSLRMLKKDIKKEVGFDINERIRRDLDVDIQNTFQKMWESLSKEVVKLSRKTDELEKQIYELQRNKTMTEMGSRPSAARDSEKEVSTKPTLSKTETVCEKFNRLVNSSELTDEFKSVNLTFVRDKLVVVNEGEPLYYMVKLSETDFQLYPNQKFRDPRALVKAKEVFDFDVQGTSEIRVEKPCAIKALLDGYGVSEKGKVCVL